MGRPGYHILYHIPYHLLCRLVCHFECHIICHLAGRIVSHVAGRKLRHLLYGYPGHVLHDLLRYAVRDLTCHLDSHQARHTLGRVVCHHLGDVVYELGSRNVGGMADGLVYDAGRGSWVSFISGLAGGSQTLAGGRKPDWRSVASLFWLAERLLSRDPAGAAH